MKNIDIRNLIAQKRLKHYEVAEALGVEDSTFSRWLYHELPEEKKKRIIEAINSIE
jgi:predicted XRE-type DNA-binding protein